MNGKACDKKAQWIITNVELNVNACDEHALWAIRSVISSWNPNALVHKLSESRRKCYYPTIPR